MRPVFQTFDLERMMSTWENKVEFNLSESGVHPLTPRELITGEDVMARLLDMPLFYPHTNGIPELRERIASLYPGASPENVLVTTGTAGANFNTALTLLSPGDEVAVMLPNYMQIWGIAKNLGCLVREFHLEEQAGWALNQEEYEASVGDRTRVITVCNPNNPTGHILSASEMEIVLSQADRVGAWIIADEVYAGSERLQEEVTPSFWGKYERVLATGGLSKAYGLPGLRIGWVVGPKETIDEIWARQEYTTICADMLASHLAVLALEPGMRNKILTRTRDRIRSGYFVLEAWVEASQGIFSMTPPQASAVAFVSYNLPMNSTELALKLIHEKNVYIVPGDHFGMDYHLRIGFGTPSEYFKEGLSRIHDLISNYE
jgi:aspartate/methionine/tyrosine aminotransferase